MNNYLKAINLIGKNFDEKELLNFRGNTNNIITAVEALLSVVFPKSYKTFLLGFGHGGPGSLIIS